VIFVPILRHGKFAVQDLVIIDKLLDGTIKKTIEMVVRYVPLI
jgi:hypothetical protein